MIHLVSLLIPGILLLSPAAWVHLGFHCPTLIVFAIAAIRPDGDSKWAVLGLVILADSLILGLTDALHTAFRYRRLAKVAGRTTAPGPGRLAMECLIFQNETAIRTLIHHPERPFWPGDSRFRSLSEFLVGCLGPRLPRQLRNPRPSQLRFIGRIAGLTATRLARHSAAIRSLVFTCVVLALAAPRPVALATCLALLSMSIWLRFYWNGSPLHRSRFAVLDRLQGEVFAAEARSRTTFMSGERFARARLEAVSRIPLRLTLANLVCLMGIAFALPPVGGRAVELLSPAVLVLACLHFCVALPVAAWLRRQALARLTYAPGDGSTRTLGRRTPTCSIAP